MTYIEQVVTAPQDRLTLVRTSGGQILCFRSNYFHVPVNLNPIQILKYAKMLKNYNLGPMEDTYWFGLGTGVLLGSLFHVSS